MSQRKYIRINITLIPFKNLQNWSLTLTIESYKAKKKISKANSFIRIFMYLLYNIFST